MSRKIKETQVPKYRVDVLKKAWNELPVDFSMNERMVFIELAESIIKMSSSGRDNSN